MAPSTPPQPDPSVIGGINEAPFVRLPDPAAVFATRARRLEFLAPTSDLAPFLSFVAALTRVQERLVAELPPPAPPDPGRLARARENAMPPLDRLTLIDNDALRQTLDAFLAATAGVDMPKEAQQARAAVIDADPDARRWLLSNVLSDAIPPEGAAPHLFVAMAMQAHLARLAATLEGARLVPVRTGICPACGGRPAVSVVVGTPGAENTRYATCATCATQWNEVRVKCLCCGSTKGIGYRTLDDSGRPEKATVRAEVCDECHSWVKILYQNLNASLDPIADDVGSLGLDISMQGGEWRRAGANPLLAGF